MKAMHMPPEPEMLPCTGSSLDLSFVDALQDIVAQFDGELRHLYVNKAIERLTGRSPESFIGHSNRELGMPPELVELWDAALIQVFRSGEPGVIQFSFGGPQGPHLMQTRLTPEFDASGRVCSVVTVARDLTHLARQLQQDRCLPSPAAIICADHPASAVMPGSARQSGRTALPLEPTFDANLEAEHFKAIVQSSDDAIISKTLDGRVTSWNAGAQAIFGYSAEEMIGRPLLVLFPFDRKEEERFILELLVAGEKVDHFETVRLRKDGSMVHVSVSISPIRDAQNRVVGASKIARDITKSKLAEARLRQSADVFTYASEGIAISDGSGSLLDVNEAFSRITGYERQQVLGQSWRVLFGGSEAMQSIEALWRELLQTGHGQGEVWSRRRDGSDFVALLTVSAITEQSGRVQSYVILFSDITPLRMQTKKLEHVAHYDAMTDLPNRLLLSDRLRQAMANSLRQEQSLAVLYLDLDGFKTINDSHGHAVGDQLLIAVSRRMSSVLREVDTLARIGGDEFVLVLVDVHRQLEFKSLLARILKACSDPIQVGDLALQVSASIGVTLFPQDNVDADQLMRHADRAMYEAKQAGKNRYQLFDAAQDAEFKHRGEALQRIQQGLHEAEFRLHFQPKVNLRTGRVLGAEALIRWQHPERGLLAPAEFLPLIERHPLDLSLGAWVLESALLQIETWQEQGLNLIVSVNLSAWQFLQEDFVIELERALRQHPRLRRDCLELEILETSSLENLQTVARKIKACRQLGVSFSIDDFGTGYSSLTYLKNLPAETLKIDQSFVRDMLLDHEARAIVQGIIGLAAAFNRQVIAEGVETPEHGAELLALGCEQVQGYGIARPMPAEEMPQWVRAWEASRS
ncbi:EAL domain-containing protein [Paucibacter sp. Y2R2-4]|uniref:sensor domain-containing protein n=1 Tax=Paucibacter sp. Y2R2-4 TaxID=2893553 RepID=UPI0021E37B0E|nr:EAL domain-containing protein [Paucibacter sp. Y2R2-4]MCV2350990.1 EAL domain-containing protein [Paucibacter sp. Y2R2-4]